MNFFINEPGGVSGCSPLKRAKVGVGLKPSVSPYGAPMLFVRKNNGSFRLCLDYKALNQRTVKNRYPMPRVVNLLDQLQGARYFLLWI